MKKAFLITSCLIALAAPSFAGQLGSGAGAGAGSNGDRTRSGDLTTNGDRTINADQATATTQSIAKDAAAAVATKVQEAAQPSPRFVRALTNVQIELTLTEQAGTAAPEKKIVSMVASSGNWGKIRSSGSIRTVGDAPIGVELNVDARPFVSVDGPIQLELTLNYVPAVVLGGKENSTAKLGLNQSLTVVLQNGKPLVISQSADPVSDRKVVIEVKATVLK